MGYLKYCVNNAQGSLQLCKWAAGGAFDYNSSVWCCCVMKPTVAVTTPKRQGNVLHVLKHWKV